MLFESKAFTENQWLLLPGKWSDSETKIFGKLPTEWTENDFGYLEYRLKQQIGIEFERAKENTISRNNNRSPEEDSVYQFRKNNLEAAIAAIPKLKYWAEQERQHQTQLKIAQEARLQQQAAYERQQKADEELARLKRDELERQRKIDEQQHIIEQEQQIRTEQAAAQVRADEAQRKRNRFLLILVGLIILIGFVWHKLFRRRCPRCKSLNHFIAQEVEIERFRGLHEFRERTTRGTKTRSVNTLMQKVRFDHHCNSCAHDWSREVRRPV